MKKFLRNIKFIGQLLRGKNHPGLSFTADVIQIKDGKEIWHGKNLSAWWNGLMDQGESNLLDAYFRGKNVPTTFYLGLGYHDETPPSLPAEGSTLADITEEDGDGYSRIEVERSEIGFPTLQQDVDGDYYVVSKQVTFQNTGTTDWSPINYLFLTDAASGNSGNLLATISLNYDTVLTPTTQLVCRIDKCKLS